MSDPTRRSQTPFYTASHGCPEWNTSAREPAGVSADAGGRKRIFISYKRDCAPDDQIAEELFRRLHSRHELFIDKTMPPGTRWAECIETKLREADFLVALISSQSVLSEMFREEVEKAHHLGKEQGGRPAILPVRLNYREPFPYALGPYLNPLNWALWRGDEDTERLIEELTKAISGEPLSLRGEEKQQVTEVAAPSRMPQPFPSAPLESPEGTMDSQSRFYVVRPTDAIAEYEMRRQGVTIPIKAPRQMGKSSLLVRAAEVAAEVGKQTVILDFQLLNQETFRSADRFYRQFCSWITDELDVENKVAEYWDNDDDNNIRCTRYFQKHLLKQFDLPLVLAMDEVESIFDTDFRSDFFGMLRNWHNSRILPKSVWKRLDLLLVTSTEPYQLIDNLNQSPFNVGTVIELEDFSPQEFRKLNQLHDSPLSQAEEERLMALLHGHPYLSRRALYLIASGRTGAAELFARAADDRRGPFGDHLRHHLFRLHGKPDLIEGLRGSIKRNACADERIYFRLRGAGLVRREGNAVVPRCRLYADYFSERLSEPLND